MGSQERGQLRRGRFADISHGALGTFTQIGRGHGQANATGSSGEYSVFASQAAHAVFL
jgi:hypothetical protein